MLYDKHKFLLVAGPCALESSEVCERVCETLKELQHQFPELNIVFSGSFDKANRTSLNSPRGPGLEKGLELLRSMKEAYGFPLSTDIHLPEHAAKVAKVCDVLQIPAFLARQTDLVVAAAKTGKVVSVKKGQFMSPYEMPYVVDKLEESNAREIWLIERGTTFGYQNLIVDMRSFPIMKSNDCPVIFDATHSVQLPGAASGKSGGERQFIEPLTLAAIASGAQGLYIETHPEPENAISDSATQIATGMLAPFIERCLRVYAASNR
ncbi:MAG: 3-deoxy-8-phosphooctulonate synthase [Verrucomicrobia bacterium CG_4_10_14_3_um_filter_43_23]|nr:MAG: 3-deoxy-8-phosphooctulonate synthase [Verrucomicrobia bacterium CG1_02_43_26]PIP60123.1 MAG: 3-deoxy-8-phosphooctulonate synthase [Verrucomicrobia bacterium CG22_combo_CG10-13_8_21_14_all_43_17]PIX57896.1 MAG: 3-deoxy-8-phosphooctulonate synthase [Verrucomicrobia bacterium CG_4_10_14_3_um_filter_43_23]PIY61119.1 MAG: 3-deoxy-8-phosphooctulonate synthase [Verrucomicrobia bacterium CG_4_10_14_0_8_um_filter_43_34]PJA43492.1 MAG: 3-deoxy-8-phosphooctulonate synthase [Verrucomicrobia bacteri